MLDLVEVMDRLRGPGGCPWDARQTHKSLVEYLVEEAYECIEAIETADGESLREELGDLLLQVVFHARIASESQGWDIDAVADGIIAKLVLRHPHVFGDAGETSAEQVEADWHTRKAKEKGRSSVTDGIPSTLPALVYAGKVLSRSAHVELPPLPASGAASAVLHGVDQAADYGDLLLALVSAGKGRGYDPESELRGAARRRMVDVRRAEGVS